MSTIEAPVQTESEPSQEPVSEDGWVAGPTWLLRRDRILQCLKKLPKGRILEVGCGAGGMLAEFAAMGLQCEALETAESAAQAARERTAQFDNVNVTDVVGDDWEGLFNCVVAFEVLEHIEFDAEAVRQWVSWLKPGGHFLLSVPAHQRRWNASDEWAGHFRRYERDALSELIQSSGLELQQLECYGFPLSNIVQPIRAKVHKSQMEPGCDAAAMRQMGTARSGVERTTERKYSGLLGSLPGRMTVGMFCRLQRLFVGTELGNNFFLHATKPEN